MKQNGCTQSCCRTAGGLHTQGSRLHRGLLNIPPLLQSESTFYLEADYYTAIVVGTDGLKAESHRQDQNIVCGCGVSGLTLKGAQSRATYGASSVHWEVLWARPTVRRHWKHLRIPREEQDNSWLPYLPRRHTRNTLK